MNKFTVIATTAIIVFITAVGGGILLIATAIGCGITYLSPFDEAEDIFQNVKMGVQDKFFDLFGTAEAKKRKANAVILVHEAQNRGFSKYSTAILVGTAIQESNLENRPYGGASGTGSNDEDSLGLLQQRPSQGWGTPEQLLDPVFATNAFLDQLQTIPDRDTRPMKDVALQIQRASPTAYNRWAWDDIAIAIVEDNWAGDGKVGNNCTVSSSSNKDWVSPLAPVYRTGDGYGNRFHPIYKVKRFHDGLDLNGVPIGTPIFAINDGVIRHNKFMGGYGYQVYIDHDGENIDSSYSHMSGFAPGLNKGDEVKAGQVIGYIGSTGGSTGAHLHLEIRVDDKLKNPDAFMSEQGVDITP